jgi:diguanylate cyclase (GGDEF)-like protein
MRIIFILAISPILALGLTLQDCHAYWKKRVLVLHSYHQGLEWTDNITKGIQSIISPHEQQYEVHYEYLDTKRNTGRDYTDKMVSFVTAKNRPVQYEVVIVSDNNALSLLNEGSIRFTGHPQIVFCGINNYDKSLTKGLDRVTGVVENTDHIATIELIRKLHPERNKITVIIDRTPTGDAIRKEFLEVEKLYKGDLEFIFLRDFLLDEIPSKLATLDENHIIYLTTFNRDRNNSFISYIEGIEVISRNTNVPIYGTWDFYLGKGIVGGRITSGYHQGQEAGRLALKILQGKQADNINVVFNSPNKYMFDYNYLTKHSIDRSLLPNDSLFINTPPTPYERYRTLLIGITLLSFSSAFIVLWKYKRQRATLIKEHALALQLEKSVKERTLELEKANKELLRLTNMDGLTQIYNRRFFDQALCKEINRLQRTSTPISVLMCDIDYFKKFNDTYGHLAGDDCIRSVANTIQKQCKRVSDIAARYGGEEFAVILPNTSSHDALLLAEAIRRGVEQEKIPHRASTINDIVTLSIGVTSMIPDLDTTPSTVVALADKALYESKLDGRNQVTLNMPVTRDSRSIPTPGMLAAIDI